MILKARLGHIRITFTIAKVVDVLGVNSKLPDGKHILMWDFDNTPLYKVVVALQRVQKSECLPQIWVLKTSEPDNYIAYCFRRVSWERCRAIIGITEGIDEAFYKWGVFRKRFTLRVGAKAGVTPRAVALIKSNLSEDAQIEELKSWVKYETLDSHHTQKVRYFEVP